MEDLSRRMFLSLMGSMAATALVGCGNDSMAVDSGNPYGTGPIPGTDAGVDAGATNFRVEANFAQIPADFPSDIASYAGRILAVCATPDPNQIVQFDPTNTVRPIPSSSFRDIEETAGRALNRFRRLSSSRGIVTFDDRTPGLNGGLYEFPLDGTGSPRLIAFPTPPSPSQNNFSGGAVVAGNKLFIAVAHGSINSDGSVSFGVGRILVYDLGSGGAIQDASVRPIATNGKNPTGMALRPGTNTLLVLNSGPVLSGMAEASLDLIDVNTEAVQRSIPLGAFRAQVSGDIAVTEDGRTAIIGSSQGSGVLFVDLETGAKPSTNIDGTNFHSSVQIGNGDVFLTEYAGSLFRLDPVTRAIRQTLSLGAPGAGPSTFVDDSLFQTMSRGAVRVYPA